MKKVKNIQKELLNSPGTPKNKGKMNLQNDSNSISFDSNTFNTMSTPKTQKSQNLKSLENSGMKSPTNGQFSSPKSLISLKTDSTLSPPRDYQIFSIEALTSFIQSMKLMLWRSQAARLISFVDSHGSKMNQLSNSKLGKIVKRLKNCIREVPGELASS